MATEETTNRAQRMLYVGGLDGSVSLDTLRAAFIPFGELVDVQLPMDYKEDKNRGFGFVEYGEESDARDALENMDGSELFGRVIRVNLARPQQKKGKAAWEEADDWYRALKEAQELEEGEGQGGASGAGAAGGENGQ